MTRARPVEVSPRARTSTNARKIVAVRADELFAHAAAARQEATPDDLHDLRIAAKRLRYSLELFPQVFGEAGEAAIETLKALQDDLGELHDLDVMLELVADELRVVAEEEVALVLAGEVPPAKNRERSGLLAFLKRVTKMRSERHAALEARWEALETEGFEERLRALAEG